MSKSRTVTGSHLLAQALKHEGVHTVFALAGDHVLPALDVMADQDLGSRTPGGAGRCI